MATPAWDDLDAFLDADDFAVAATLQPRDGGPARPLVGLFDGPYVKARLGGYQMDASAPTFTGKAADFVGIHRGDTVDIPGEGSFSVLTEPQGDGTGMAVLELAADA